MVSISGRSMYRVTHLAVILVLSGSVGKGRKRETNGLPLLASRTSV